MHGRKDVRNNADESPLCVLQERAVVQVPAVRGRVEAARPGPAGDVRQLQEPLLEVEACPVEAAGEGQGRVRSTA